MSDDKIVQIVPAERGWHCAHFYDESGSYSYEEVACWGLRADGTVVALIPAESGGALEPASSDPNGIMGLLSPTQSWNYRWAEEKPDNGDHEAVGAAALPDGSVLTLWREKPEGRIRHLRQESGT